MSRFKKYKKLTQPIYKTPKNIQGEIPVYRISESGIFQLENKKAENLYDKAYRFTDVNYSTKDVDGQEEIFIQWCKILNSLNVSFKIVVANLNRNMDDYKKEVMFDLKGNEYDAIRKAYNENIKDKMATGKSGINQQKYFVISAVKNTYEDADAYFQTIENSLKNRFLDMGSKLIPMNAIERLSALHSIYRLGKETEFSFDWDEAVSHGRDWRDEICNLYLQEHKDHLEFEDRVYRVLYAKKYSSSLPDEFMQQITSVPYQSIITLDAVPLPKEVVVAKLMDTYMASERSIEKQQEQRNKNGAFTTEPSYDKRKEKEETEEYLDQVRRNDEKMFLVGFTIVVMAKDEKELESRTNSLQLIANSHNMTLETHWLRQKDSFKTSLPLGCRFVNTMRPMFTQPLAVLMPFNVQELQMKKAVCYGVNQVSKNLIMGSRKQLPSGNGFVFGKTGFGKSFFIKMEAGQIFVYFEDDDIIIIDPQNEYFEVAEALNGTVVNLTSSTDTYINPMEFDPERISIEDHEKRIHIQDGIIAEKAEFMLGICEQVMHQELNSHHRTLIDRCVRLMYQYTFQNIHEGKAYEMPTMRIFQEYLKKQDLPEARNLAISLELFIEGSLSIFAHESNVDVDNRMMVYGIKDLGNELRAVSILVMMENIRQRVYRNWKKGKGTWIYIDEFHVLADGSFATKYLEGFWKEVRKMGGICTGITQNVVDVAKNPTMTTMLSNSEFVMLLKQEPGDRDKILEVLDVSENELRYVTQSGVGRGLIRFGDKTMPNDVSVEKDTMLYDLFNTNFHEIVEKGKLLDDD